MSADQTVDVFAAQAYGKAALRKLGDVDTDFRLYEAGFADEYGTMKVTGAIFRIAFSGQNKGKFCVKVDGSDRTVYVSREDINKERP